MPDRNSDCQDTSISPRTEQLPFKPRARLLVLLGDQLIRDAGMAVFELVKNAYDADASYVSVRLSDISDPEHGLITVQDDGSGMDWDIVANIWLEPGTTYRGDQRAKGTRSTHFHRLPLGEKGVGRFAAHKLGRRVELVTRKADSLEVVVHIDWDQIEQARYLSDVGVVVEEREPTVFTGNKTGTQIRIWKLRGEWSRRTVRELYRSVTSINSPFNTSGSFKCSLVITPESDWLKGLLTIEQVMHHSLFRAKCKLYGQTLKYDYSFIPYLGMDRVSSRETSRTMSLTHRISREEFENIDLGHPYEWPQQWPDYPLDKESERKTIGAIEIDLYVFDREPKTLQLGVTDKKGLKDYLDENGGVRVYRDGIRVYDYGEPGNDWLGLGGRRVNVPAQRISNNQVIGAVNLSLEHSQGLLEKTNREGFVENESYRTFKAAVNFCIQQIEAERNIDKMRIRIAYSNSKVRESVLEEIERLRVVLAEKGLTGELGSYVDAIETQFLDMRDRLLTAAGAGLSLATVIHEVEKGIGDLANAVERTENLPRIKELAIHLTELIEGLTYLTRRSGQSDEKASTLIKQAIFNTAYRLRYHKISIENGIQNGMPDFTVRCTRRLIIASLMNLIDNSIWWLENKGAKDKLIYLGTSEELEYGPSIILADNGPGFIDPPEYLTQPFVTRRPDGMGLGLHIVNEVMKTHEGRLIFPQEGDVTLPEGMNGAVIALAFRRGK